MQNRYALSIIVSVEPQKLFNRVRVEETVQWEFRRVWESLDYLPAQRPAPTQNRQLRIEALFVEPIEQLHRLAFGAARVETVDQVEHPWASGARHMIEAVRESELGELPSDTPCTSNDAPDASEARRRFMIDEHGARSRA